MLAANGCFETKYPQSGKFANGSFCIGKFRGDQHGVGNARFDHSADSKNHQASALFLLRFHTVTQCQTVQETQVTTDRVVVDEIHSHDIFSSIS